MDGERRFDNIQKAESAFRYCPGMGGTEGQGHFAEAKARAASILATWPARTETLAYVSGIVVSSRHRAAPSAIKAFVRGPAIFSSQIHADDEFENQGIGRSG